MNHTPFTVTPNPTDLPQWREQGSHSLPDGTCCHCGPANCLTGPQYVCDCAEAHK